MSRPPGDGPRCGQDPTDTLAPGSKLPKRSCHLLERPGRHRFSSGAPDCRIRSWGHVSQEVPQEAVGPLTDKNILPQ
ncbi:hypothetical protein GN956_G25794 [Arapaima gigas]